MHLRTTVLLLLLALGLGAIILGIERYLPSTRELREMKRGPVKFNRSEVTHFEVDSSGGDGVTLAREEGTWWVRRPFNDHADPDKVTKLFDELLAIGWIERVHREEFDAAGWAKTGLDQPRQKLRLKAGKQTVLDLWLGAPSALQGGHYLGIQKIREKDETVYYVAKTTLPDLLKPAPKEWRDSKLVRLSAENVTSLKLVQEGGQIEMKRVAGTESWVLVKPLNTRGSKEKIGELLSTLLNLEIKDAVETSAGSATAIESGTGSTGIIAQSLKVTLTSTAEDKTSKSVEITLTKPAADAVETKATASHRRPVFTVVSKSLGDLWSQPNDLRDRMLARIDEDAVAAVRIDSLVFAPVLLVKESESWFLKRHNKLEPANGDRVARLFESLNTHPIRSYASDSAANLSSYGLDKPFLTVAMVTSESKQAKILFGANAERTEFFAKYESEPSVYQIDATLLPSIPQDGIKWKGLGALRFTQFALRQISLSLGTNPPLILKYDPTTAQWTGERAGRDITPMIDRVKADRLAGLLAKLNVQDWSADATNAITALQKPALRIVVTLGEPGINTGPTRDITLNFAPTQEGMESTALYFGQVDSGPDVFYISRTALMEMLESVFKE
ncbi:uncharacterized protein DUF4340 [Prosthecobacter fusiformis]|uniref:Uncharacterized protein DUF4340 n=1 Tax=Prosthecobacter fusiformis TaxID=48464 RepID=A0A4R7RXX9_9BACT|nr:DUF4340 domain-containing protein [Prosthecobacter fusiformis]TDU70774.1 uncharacterized protein DUF4340 [Prosthecobacter fusiformis]